MCFVTGLSMSGAERQLALIARVLGKQHQVTVLGYQAASNPFDVSDWKGLQLTIVRPREGILNTLVLGPLQLIKELRRLNPDVCVQRSAGKITGYVGLYCYLFRKRFIFHSASYWDADPKATFGITRSLLLFLLYSLGLRLANVFVAQTSDAARRFAKGHKGHRKSIVVVPQIYDVRGVAVDARKSKFVLWIGRFAWYKRPQLFVDLARVLAHIKFVIVGYGSMAREIEQQASGVHNLRLTGALNHKDALQVCGRAALLVNTSLFEGFPNTLLECGARRTPIVSLSYDPDEIICKYNIGRHSRTFGQLIEDTRLLMRDDNARSTCGSNARHYVESHHSPEAVRKLYEKILVGVSSPEL